MNTGFDRRLEKLHELSQYVQEWLTALANDAAKEGPSDEALGYGAVAVASSVILSAATQLELRLAVRRAARQGQIANPKDLLDIAMKITRGAIDKMPSALGLEREELPQ